jgi:hypothetical protein
MFDLSTFGTAVITIGGFTAFVALIRAIAGNDELPLDETPARGIQEEEPIRFRFAMAANPATSGAAA